MKQFKGRFQSEVSVDAIPFPLLETVFFDIETTGFAAKSSKLYLIGTVHAVDLKTFEYTQFFAEKEDEEALVLFAFFDSVKNFKNIVHFNGNGFDIPYILAKCKSYNMLFNFDRFTGYDLYKEAQKHKAYFKTENLKQRTLEEFFGVFREEQYSGKELINLYYEFLENNTANSCHTASSKAGDANCLNHRKKELLELLLLHNLQDIRGMLSLLGIYSYSCAFQGDFTFDSYTMNEFKGYDNHIKKELLMNFTLTHPVPSKISGGNEIFYFSMNENSCKIRVRIRTDELKFFYPDFKNYYYLPKEDFAIHKSVSFYVDKDYRTQAKAATCYSKKSGCFLPEYEEIIRPYFKAEYDDKVLYFEADSEFLSEEKKLKDYALHVLGLIKKI